MATEFNLVSRSSRWFDKVIPALEGLGLGREGARTFAQGGTIWFEAAGE